MTKSKLHYVSGLLISMFVGIHLFNHAWSVFGAEEHIDMMKVLRPYYRNIIVETILLIAIGLQIYSGMKLAGEKKTIAISGFNKLQIWSGIYLAIFFLIHLSAVLGGRILLNLDTNFYFGVAGLNSFPFSLFFFPYYGIAVISFFGHLAAIHSKKMKYSMFGFDPRKQAYVILIFGFLVTGLLFYGFTDGFQGVIIPREYGVLIGK